MWPAAAHCAWPLAPLPESFRGPVAPGPPRTLTIFPCRPGQHRWARRVPGHCCRPSRLKIHPWPRPVGWRLGRGGKGGSWNPDSGAAHLIQPRQTPVGGPNLAGATGQREHGALSYLGTPRPLCWAPPSQGRFKAREDMSACEAPLSAGRVPSCPQPPAQHWCACSGSSQQTPRLGRPRLLLGAPQLSQALSLLPPSAPEAMKILRALAAWAGHAPDSGTAPRVGARGRREAEERARLHSVPRTLSPARTG